MAQKTLIQTPVALFATVGGKTEERGNCACAIVAKNSSPPKFTLVCYNEQRQVLASASITSNNEQSLRFQMQSNEYANFVDNQGNSWSLLFLRSADVDLFCANLGSACYGAAGKPTHNATLCDMSHPTQRSKKKLKLGDRGKVRFAAFDVEVGASPSDAPRVARLLGTNGDIPYNFSAVQSMYSIFQDGKGFEANVVDMAEGSVRVVVLPSSVPRSCGNQYGSASIAFVIHLNRIIADDVPLITDTSSHAPDLSDGNSTALVPVQLELANISVRGESYQSRAASTPRGSTARSTPRGSTSAMYSGAGVPVEHMGVLQKVSAQMNSTMTQIRDLEDKVGNFQEEWKQTQNRPKPSLLTAQTLEQQVKQLVLENERVKDEISRRDELIRSIEERNRDLQKRMDRAAEMAQNLLDEKQTTVSSTGDLRLEQDRQIMKLQETITKVSTERDDIGRHLTTVKKMLDMTDSDLRDVKGRYEVFQVQLQALANKLDASEDQFGEERSRRKALEAKAGSVNEEIRHNAADLHMKRAQVQDLERKSESDRLHHVQLVEDERQRRAMDTQQLRSEILNELQTREERFQADRARVMEDNHSRGREEGKEIGKKNAAIDLSEKLEALKLEAQRVKTELDANKTLVRSVQEEAMGENRRLEAIVTSLKNTADQETRKKAQGEFKLQTLKGRVRNVEDALFMQMTNCTHRLRRPIPPADVMALLAAIRDDQNPDFSFQQAQHDAEVAESIARRIQWIEVELETQYGARQNSLYNQTYVPQTMQLWSELKADIARLWKERDDAMFGSCYVGEQAGRDENEAEESADFEAIVAFQQGMIEAQGQIIQEEEAARPTIEDEAAPFFEALEERQAQENKERAELCLEEEPLRTAIDEEAMEFYAPLEELKENQRIDRLAVEDEEEQPRREIDAESMEFYAPLEKYLEAQRHEREDLEKEEEAPRTEIEVEAEPFFEQLDTYKETQSRERADLVTEEEAARTTIEEEEAPLTTQYVKELETKLFEKIIEEQQEVLAQEEAARSEWAVAEFDSDEGALQDEAITSQKEAASKQKAREDADQAVIDCEAEETTEREQLEKDLDADGEGILHWDTDDKAEMERARIKAEKKAVLAPPGPLDVENEDGEKQQFTVASDSSSSGSDAGFGTRLSGKLKAPPKKATAKASGKPSAAAKPAGKLWDSDSDESDTDKAPVPAPKKKAAPKKTAPAKLFDSESDE